MSKKASDDAVQFALFVSNLASLVERGFKPVEALRVLDEAYGKSKPTPLSQAVEQIVEDLESGASIAEAFTDTDFFPEDFISLLSAGEVSSSLVPVLRQYSRYLTTYQTANRAFRSAMTYPLVMLSAIVAAVIGFTGFLIPRMLLPMVQRANKPIEALPMAGQVLFKISEVVSFAGPVGALLLGAGILYYIWKPGRKHIEKLFLLIPAMRRLFHRLSWATYLKSLSMLLSSGLLLRESLEACEVLAPSNIRPVYDDIVQAVEEGGTLSGQFAEHEVDSLITLSVESGEKSGQLSEMADSMAEQYMAGMEQEIKQASSSLEPVVIVLLAVVGGSMAGGLMMTIMSLSR